ncbi:MAG: hypothetical protein OXH09_12820 [Gammaproteobacteria bacterium]|nr:hypothetical protein [Gammaproteobacteria bacterium]
MRRPRGWIGTPACSRAWNGSTIHRSYQFGKLAADAIADHLDDDAPNPGDVVAAAYRGDAWKRSARWCFDNLPVAVCMELGVTATSLFRRVAGKVFFDRFAAG